MFLSLSLNVCVERCFYSSTGKNVSISNKKWAFILIQFKIIDSELTKTDMFEILMSKNNMFESYSWKKMSKWQQHKGWNHFRVHSVFKKNTFYLLFNNFILFEFWQLKIWLIEEILVETSLFETWNAFQKAFRP